MKWIIAVLWILLGVVYYFAQGECCLADASTTTENVVPAAKFLPIKKLSPVSFDCKDDTPKLDKKWQAYKDSLMAVIADDRILEIKTYEFRDERGEQPGDLAVARGTNIRQLFEDLEENKIRFETDVFEDDCIKKRMYELVELKTLRNSVKVKEISDGANIYFPSNSTDELSDPDIELYLDEVAARVSYTKENVRLTGHTDSDGDAGMNLQIGQARADYIKSYLMSKGVASNQIIASSKGESDPIASNQTAEGKEKNRRTELRIIK